MNLRSTLQLVFSMATAVRTFVLAAAVIIAFGAFSAPAFGQAISGDLTGTVSDATGASIQNATVTAENTATGVKFTASTNDHGEYRFTNLPPGTYKLTVAANGFSTSELQNVSVQLNQTKTANVTLQVGQVSSSVSVVESSAVIDTTTAQIQNTFTTKDAQDLPNVSQGLGVLNLSLLSSGVASSGGVGYGAGPSIGGQRPTNNNFTIDGVDNNSKNITGPQVLVPNDSVAEFTLLQNQFQAEYGHSSGGQFTTIVKSGSNQFHGILYEYFKNRNLNAVDQSLANQGIFSNPRFDQNRLGAGIGGPILKNKLFYFASFEYVPLGQASTQGNPTYAPTSQGYSILNSIPGISKTNVGVLQQFAVAPSVASGSSVPTLSVRPNNDPNAAAVNIPLGIVPTVGPNYANGYFGVLSMDYNLSERDQVRGRFIYNKNQTIYFLNVDLPYFYTPVPTSNYLGSVAWYHTFAPTLTNELRLGYNRQNQSFPIGNYSFPGLDQFPNLGLADLGLTLGPNSNFPQFNINNLYQATENVVWTRGNHTFKFGTEFRKYIAPSVFVQRSRGDYEYTDTNLYLFDQTPDHIAQRGLGNTTFYGDQIASYSYAQDTWRMRPNLTLDLGVRYEHTTVPYSERLQSVNSLASVPGLISFNSPQTQNTAFAPRIGIAYSPGKSGNTAIRAGFGMAYDVLFDNLGTLSLPPQFSTTVDVTGNPTPPGGFLKTGGIPPNAPGGGPLSVADARANTSAFIPNQVLPYSLNWTLDIQQVFAKDYTFQARYIGTRGVHLPFQQQIDRIPVVTPNHFIPTYLAAPSAATLAALPLTRGDLQAEANSGGNFDPRFFAAGFQSPITAFTPQGWSHYNGLALQLNRRFAHGFQLVGAYTWSHLIDNGTAVVHSTELTPRRAQSILDLTTEKAASALDRRHRMTVTAIYDAPWFKSSGNWFMKNLAGNWEIAPIYTYESPEYYTPQSGVDSNLNGDAAPDRTIVNASGVAGTGSGVVGLDRQGNRVNPNGAAAGSIVAYLALNPNARYIQAQKGALANGGRNTQATRPIDNIDLTVVKRFSFRERFKFELAAQAYNVFNHAQFIPGSINDVQLVTSNGTASYTNPQSPAFNDPTQIFTSNARTVQIFGKIIW